MSMTSDILSTEDQQYLYNIPEVDNFLVQDELLGFEESKPLFIPMPLTGVIPNDDLSGDFEFEVTIHPNGSKNAWVYSTLLNKVYLDMKCQFPVDFRVKHNPDFPTFIRVTPIFSSPQYAHEPVTRCVNHSYGDSKEFTAYSHIIRCENNLAQYLGNNLNKEHLSIVVPFSKPRDGTDSVREMFKFFCKNSCPMPGINRRDIEVIFTLEDYDGKVLGRRPLNVRICSCPNRDKGKDEDKAQNATKDGVPKGKKRKIEVLLEVRHESDELILPVCSQEHKKQVVKFYHDLLAGDIHSMNERQMVQQVQPYKKCLEKITKLRKDLEGDNN